MVTVEILYKNFGVLADAKDKAGEHEAEFKAILGASKSGTSEKRLAAQFIPRFFKYFPQLAEEAIDAQVDLCEDEDVSIRKQAIKDLPAFCKDIESNTERIAAMLAQLMTASDAGELSIVHHSMMSLFQSQPKAVLQGLFQEITAEDDSNREANINFLTAKISKVPQEKLVKCEEYLVQETRKVLQDVTGDEFVSFITMLSKLQSMNTLQGRKELIDIVIEQADLDSPFDASELDCIDKLQQCVNQALPFFSKNVHADKFVEYICIHVLPQIATVAKEVETSERTAEYPDIQLDVFKLLAELSVYTGQLQNLDDCTEKVYNKLLEYMPLPPSSEEEEASAAKDGPQLHFSYVECLMFAFHQLASKCPEFFSLPDQAERLKDFKSRLSWFGQGLQVYIKQLRAALKERESGKAEESKFKLVALKTCFNINTLIKDLFRSPPSFKSLVSLSWKPIKQTPVAPAVAAVGQKRSGITPIKYDAKRTNKGDVQMYAPPTGKWSDNAGTYQAPRGRGGFRGRFNRGGFRGRGRGWRGNRW